jgi:hypothetical protein
LALAGTLELANWDKSLAKLLNMFKPRSVKTRLVLVAFGYGNLALALFRISGVASDSAWKKEKASRQGLDAFPQL